jgi:protein-S-isoprenylcysteine O-methyltransferase Ste14
MRLPIYFFTSITFIGISIASASWIMLLMLVLYSFIDLKIILAEEQYLLKTYGESYREYKEKVPRYFIFF